MSENWATPELTEEQTAEMAKEQAEASETEPAQLNPQAHEDKDDPPQIDRRSASERIIGEPEKKDDEEEKPVIEVKTEIKEPEAGPVIEEKPTPASQDGDIDADWFKDLPEDAKGHYRGLRVEMQRIREQRRNEREESERRIKQMMDSVPEQITKGIKDAQPPIPEPDPDEDPEGFRAYHAQRTEKAEAAAKEAGDSMVVSHDEQEVLTWMGAQEATEPEFNSAFKYLYDYMVEEKVQRGRSRSAAEIEVHQFGVDEGRKLHKEGGNWVKAVKYYAEQAGWKANSASATLATAALTMKSSGAETAATIAAGEKAAKILGKGGSGAAVGELTIEDITNITDPEEHAKAYQRWVDKEIGKSPDWTPR